MECLTFYGGRWSGELYEHLERPVESAEDCLSLCKSKGTQTFSWFPPLYEDIIKRKRCVCKNKDNGRRLIKDEKGAITGETSCTGMLNN